MRNEQLNVSTSNQKTIDTHTNTLKQSNNEKNDKIYILLVFAFDYLFTVFVGAEHPRLDDCM